MWKSNFCSWKVISCKNEYFSPVGFCSLTPQNTILQENLYLLGNAVPSFLTGDVSACLFSLTFIKTWGEGIKTVFSISVEAEFTTLPLKVSSNRSYIILNLTGQFSLPKLRGQKRSLKKNISEIWCESVCFSQCCLKKIQNKTNRLKGGFWEAQLTKR